MSLNQYLVQTSEPSIQIYREGHSTFTRSHIYTGIGQTTPRTPMGVGHTKPRPLGNLGHIRIRSHEVMIAHPFKLMFVFLGMVQITRLGYGASR